MLEDYRKDLFKYFWIFLGLSILSFCLFSILAENPYNLTQLHLTVAILTWIIAFVSLLFTIGRSSMNIFLASSLLFMTFYTIVLDPLMKSLVIVFFVWSLIDKLLFKVALGIKFKLVTNQLPWFRKTTK